MNKSESKYFNTALRMDEALIALLEEKDLEYITVKEICRRAGVNRSTFYLHYETIADLTDEAMDMIDRRFLSYFPRREEEITDGIASREREELVLVTREYLLPYLRFIRDNKKVYRAAFRAPRQRAGRPAVRKPQTAHHRPRSGAVRSPGRPPPLLHGVLCGGHRRHRQGVAAAGLRG